MQRLSIIGNLGSDAEVRAREDNSKFVTFKVADSNRWTDLKGVVHESTQWISCVLNGDGGKILPFLKQGVKVFVEGRPTYRVYSSQKERSVKCGVDIAVSTIELCGGSSDEVPKQLVDADGALVEVSKFFWTSPELHKSCMLYSTKGSGTYNVDENGFILPLKSKPAEQKTEQSAEATKPAEATKSTENNKKK